MKNLLLGVFGSVLGILVASTGIAQDTESRLRPAKVIKIIAKPVTQLVQTPAIVSPSQEAELSFRASGRIAKLPVRAAAFVAKANITAKLETPAVTDS